MKQISTVRTKKAPAFVAFVKDSTSNDAARSVASNHGWSESCVHYGDIRQAIVYLSEQTAPKTLLVEVPSAEAAPELLDKLADVCTPNMRVIVAGNVDEFSFYSWLQSIGIEHYLLQPFDAKMLNDTIHNRAAKKDSDTQESENRTIAVIGARGGVGATTIATNLAHILAEHHGQHTAIVDTDPHFGSVANAFDIMPNHGLRDALEKPDRIDEMFLNRVMIEQGNLSILSAEESYSEMLSNSAAAAESLVSELAKQFAYTVIDLPCTLNSFTRSVLAQADHIVMVGELSLLSLRDMLRLRDYIKTMLATNGTTHTILNRCGIGGEHELTLKEFTKNLEDKIDYHVPFTRDAFLATSSGELLVETTKNPAVKETLKQLAAALGNLTDEVDDEVPEEIGLLASLMTKIRGDGHVWTQSY